VTLTFSLSKGSIVSVAVSACELIMQVFEIWYKMLQDPEKFFRRAYDKKLTCTGLLCLLGLPMESLPASLSSSLPLVSINRQLEIALIILECHVLLVL
jgi:hypothetical protein